MKSLLILRRMKIENANAISGLTYGFPAVSHFLGFTHALSRLISKEFEVTLDRCGVIVHRHQLKTRQPKGWGDHVFALSRNPLTKEGKTAPFNEEGKVHMEVSMLIEVNGYLPESKMDDLVDFLAEKLSTFRVAGGVITHHRQTGLMNFPADTKAIRKLLFSLLPGFVLMDRSELLQTHFKQLADKNPDVDILDAWLDFSSLKYQAIPELDEGEPVTEDTPAHWEYVPKPAPGYLVPIMIGYKGISPLYQPGEVVNARDSETPFRFVEATYGIGEWVSPHKLTDIESLLWRYQTNEDWYLCTQAQ